MTFSTNNALTPQSNTVIQLPAMLKEHTDSNLKEMVTSDDSDAWAEDDLQPLKKVFQSIDQPIDPAYSQPHCSSLIPIPNNK